MIGLAFYNSHNTTLDLNGPFLRFTSTPESVTVNAGDDVTLSGLATAEFKHNPTTIPGERVTNTGEIVYQWYIDGIAAEDISGKISGSQTNEITIQDLQNPSETGKEVFLRASYTQSAYQSESGAITAGIARSTGKAFNANQRLDSNDVSDAGIVVVTVNPTISITTQPSDTSVAQGQDATFTVVASASDGSDVSYRWSQDGVELSDNNDISGSTSSTLTISSSTIGSSTITVTVSHPTAGNSPITSDEATLTIVDARQMIVVEQLDYTTTTSIVPAVSYNLYERQEQGLGPIRLDRLPGSKSFVVHASEKDVKLKITVAGPAGGDRNGNQGGEGGLSIFTFNLPKDDELTLKIGPNYSERAGLGGAGAFIYYKAAMLVTVGAGGGAGENGQGGDGGGIGLAGGRGSGPSPGAGGARIEDGAAPVGGIWQGNGSAPPAGGNTSPEGGRASGCTIGGYYRRLGTPPCSDLGLVRARTAAGPEITDSQIIERGYKAGLAYRNNGGVGSNVNGGGGAGFVGGNASTNRGGGGGGSGYTSGLVDVLSTQLGGNPSDVGYFLIELANDVETVTFTQDRSTNENHTVIMTLVSGFGPNEIRFGKPANYEDVVVDIEKDSIYEVSETQNVDSTTFTEKTLTVSDLDSNPGSMTITVDKGRWTSTTTYQFT